MLHACVPFAWSFEASCVSVGRGPPIAKSDDVRFERAKSSSFDTMHARSADKKEKEATSTTGKSVCRAFEEDSSVHGKDISYGIYLPHT
jgi:hypothetical protein